MPEERARPEQAVVADVRPVKRVDGELCALLGCARPEDGGVGYLDANVPAGVWGEIAEVQRNLCGP